MKRRAKIFNRIADLYAAGRADWLYIDGQNAAVALWGKTVADLGEEEADRILEVLGRAAEAYARGATSQP